MQSDSRYPLASDRSERPVEERSHFDRRHPVSAVAARLCSPDHAGRPVGGPACGRCWERAIRDDERFVIEFDVPREVKRDPMLVDDIAVQLACQGEPVRLTAVELRTAVSRLVGQGLDRSEIGRRLNRDAAMIGRVLVTLQAMATAAETQAAKAAGQAGEAVPAGGEAA